MAMKQFGIANMEDDIAEWKATAEQSDRLDAGCKILEERVAEAWEPEWRQLLDRIYDAMNQGAAFFDKKPTK